MVTNVSPDSDAKSGSNVSSRPLAMIALSFLVGALLAVMGFLLVVRASQNWSRSVGAWLQRTTRTDLSQPTVVDRIQKLQRLETVVFTMEKIVTGEKESSVLPNFLAGDRMLLLVHGEAIAGIDFQMLKPADVQVTGKKIRVHVPQAELLVTRIDSSKTRVYSRQTGLLVPTDPNLESQVREEAERDLRRSALADGILQRAQENARSTLMSLMQSMGFEEVQFE